jgi:tetratricopeptide (TPR) repeat protein
VAEGEFALVREILEPTLTTPSEWIGDHDLYAMLADVAACQGDEAAIRVYARQAEALATRYNHTLYLAIAHRAWGVAYRLAGEFEAAATRFNQSLTLFRALGTQWQLGRTLFELGKLAMAQAKVAAARTYYIDSLSAFERMGAVGDAARLRDALDQLGDS